MSKTDQIRTVLRSLDPKPSRLTHDHIEIIAKTIGATHEYIALVIRGEGISVADTCWLPRKKRAS